MSDPLLISAAQLRRMLLDDDEIALLDVREEGVFGKAHLFYASCAPLGRLQQMLPRLVPRRGCRIVFCEEGDQQALQAAQAARSYGYGAAFALRGGHEAALAEGFELFSGVNVPSKAFGEFIESSCRTPSLSADELQAAVKAGEDLVIMDSRPFVEYTVRNIPGGISCPGAELAYRVFTLAPDPRTRVIVNCAGRTRSIIGAQSLINAGIPNSVMALRNGTMGWHLAGFPLEEGMSCRAPEVADESLARAQQAAGRVRRNFQVQSIDDQGLRQWREQSDRRTLYVFDVRHPEEYLRGHLPGSRCAPGGQLIQETEQFMATLGARVVLVDDDGVRATMTASWLLQMGWREVRVLQGGIGDAAERVTGAEVSLPSLGVDDLQISLIGIGDLTVLIARGEARVLDVSLSSNYREGHIPGALNLLRSELGEALADNDGSATLVVSSEDGEFAALAASDIGARPGLTLKVLSGGNRAWQEADQPIEIGPGQSLRLPVDRYQRPYEKDWGDEQAMRDYLTWEVALVPKLKRDGSALFLREA